MENSEIQWRIIYKTGAITTIFVLAGIILDMVVGSVTGGDLATLPQTAIERFNQFNDNCLLGLYNLDLLNTIIQILFIPSFFALYASNRSANNPMAMLSLILFLVGTTVFVCSNTSLTMLDLSHKYFQASTDNQRLLLAAAGETMLAKGSHGSFSVFIGFALIPFSNAMMSSVMAGGKVFGSVTSWFGIAGNSLMVIYVIMVTFMPAVERIALAFAMPAGLLVMAWMIMFAVKLFRMSK